MSGKIRDIEINESAVNRIIHVSLEATGNGERIISRKSIENL